MRVHELKGFTPTFVKGLRHSILYFYVKNWGEEELKVLWEKKNDDVNMYSY